MEPDSSWRCTGIGQEVADNLENGKFQLYIRKDLIFWGWSHTRRGCPDRLWNLNPWRFNKFLNHFTYLILLWAGPPDYLKRSLSTHTILWCYDMICCLGLYSDQLLSFPYKNIRYFQLNIPTFAVFYNKFKAIGIHQMNSLSQTEFRKFSD